MSSTHSKEVANKARQNKCTFFIREVEFLGHFISEEGAANVKQWPTPRNTRKVCSFLEFASYYLHVVILYPGR